MRIVICVFLLAVIGGSGYFIYQRVRQNNEDRRVIDKTLNDMKQDETKAMGGK